MIVTTKQIRILASITVPLVWLIYAAFSYGLISYPRDILGNPVNYWSLPAVWTILWIGIIMIDYFGVGDVSSSATWFLLIFIALSFLLQLLLPYVGVGLNSTLFPVCYLSCATLTINWVGGVSPLVAGTAILVADIYRHGPGLRARLHVGLVFAVASAFLIVVLFHDVSVLGVATESKYAGLAAWPVFLVVQGAGNLHDAGNPTGLVSSREIVRNALIIYSVLALVYFLADLAALPLLLTPANSVTNSTWIIGADGIQDGNFFFPLSAMISYLVSQYLIGATTKVITRVRAA